MKGSDVPYSNTFTVTRETVSEAGQPEKIQLKVVNDRTGAGAVGYYLPSSAYHGPFG